MRKYLRRIARHRMEREGVRRINRTRESKGRVFPSYFAQHWRDVVHYPKRAVR